MVKVKRCRRSVSTLPPATGEQLKTPPAPTPPEQDSNLRRYKDTLVRHSSTKFFEGLMPVHVDTVTDLGAIKYKGPKIPAKLWERVKAFMLWGYAEFDSEVMLRLFFNPKRGTWRALPFPQEIGQGMYVNEDDKSPRWEPTCSLVPSPDWVPMGSVHHHCGGSAFQSGTDHKDEKTRPGLHVTFGSLTSESMTMHARVIKAGEMYEASLDDWLVDTTAAKPPATRVFPSFWKKQCKEKVHVPVAVISYGRGGYAQNRQQWEFGYGTDYGYGNNAQPSTGTEWMGRTASYTPPVHRPTTYTPRSYAFDYPRIPGVAEIVCRQLRWLQEDWERNFTRAKMPKVAAYSLLEICTVIDKMQQTLRELLAPDMSKLQDNLLTPAGVWEHFGPVVYRIPTTPRQLMPTVIEALMQQKTAEKAEDEDLLFDERDIRTVIEGEKVTVYPTGALTDASENIIGTANDLFHQQIKGRNHLFIYERDGSLTHYKHVTLVYVDGATSELLEPSFSTAHR